MNEQLKKLILDRQKKNIVGYKVTNESGEPLYKDNAIFKLKKDAKLCADVQEYIDSPKKIIVKTIRYGDLNGIRPLYMKN